MTSSVIVHPSSWSKPREVINEIAKRTILHEFAGGGEGLKDVQNGFVSIEKAKEDYGVVIDPLTYEVDEEETRRLRGSPHTQGD